MGADMPIAKEFLRVSSDFILGQYWPRVKSCVEGLTAEQVQWRPPDGSVPSIGEILHRLADSVFRAIAACNIDRLGPSLTNAAGTIPRTQEKLIGEIDAELEEFDSALRSLTPEALAGRRIIGGRELTLMEVVMELGEELATSYGEISHLASVQSDLKSTCEY